MRFYLLDRLLKFFYFTAGLRELRLLLLVNISSCDKPAGLQGRYSLREKYG